MIKRVKGFKDILHSEAKLREKIILKAIDLFEKNGFKELQTPILEKTELFVRSIGDTTDIVQKEMFTFEDKGGELLTLRPEGTAGVVRAFIENSLFQEGKIQKIYYFGPMFRRERPQKGRLRQFNQIGIECFGSTSPLTDAHIIFLLYELLKRVKVKNIEIHINSIGCKNCRPVYQKNLVEFLKKHENNLCKDCSQRLNKNPLRVLDCKNENCKEIIQNSPKIIDYLCTSCKEHFNMVKNFLNYFKVEFIENPFIVRGLDYYTKTVFEAISSDLGGQNAVGAGGRYDSLVNDIGGKDIPGIGFAVGVERILLLTEEEVGERFPDVFLIMLGEGSYKKGFEIYNKLIDEGFYVEFDYEMDKLKKQLKKADKLNAKYSLIIGEDEVKRGMAILRNMENGSQENLNFQEIPKKLRSLL